MAMMRPPTEMTTMHENTSILDVQGGHHSLNMDSDSSPKKKGSVQVKLELGHKAITRKKPTPEGFTHDWTMFVRGPEGSNIQHFVDRVIFYLHESFPKPKRVVKEPPYQINESGYAGFNLPIEIYFKNKDDPKKIIFSYDLFLHTPHSPPVNHVRCEKLTFQNPSEEFRRKLVKAGGMAILGPNDQSQPGLPANPLAGSPRLEQPHTPESKAFADLFGAPAKTEPVKIESTKTEQTRTESIKTESAKKHKSSSSKERSGGRNKSSSSSQGSTVSPTSGPATGTPPSAVTPPSTPSKEAQKQQASNSASKHAKDRTNKRSAESATGPSEQSKKKRKENDNNERSKEREEKKEREKREQEREKEQQREEKEKEKRDKEKEKERKRERKGSSRESKNKHKSSKKEAVKPKNGSPRGGKSSPAVALSQGRGTPTGQPEIRTLAAKKAPPSVLDELSMGEISGFDDDSLDMNMDISAEIMAAVCSPASTLSFSSTKGPAGGEGSGPLKELFAEMDDDEVPLSPLPQTSDSPLQHFTKNNSAKEQPLPPPQPPASALAPAPVPELKIKEPSPPTVEPKPPAAKAKKRDKDKESRRSRTERRTKEASKENKEVPAKNGAKEMISKDLFKDFSEEEKATQGKAAPGSDLGERDMNNLQQPASSVVAPNGESLKVLLELQQRLMTMTDRDLVQQVVNVIEETGMYKISDATFDFDLCSLDINTVKKLQVCLEMVC